MQKIAILFPGQGSQESGMGRDVAENFSQAMDLWKKAEHITKAPLREIYWESNDDVLMAKTETLQIALTVVNISYWQAIGGQINPSATAGHSLGEYSAYVAASVLNLDEVLNMVALRGQLMAAADPDGIGAMAAILKMNRKVISDLTESVAKHTGETLIVANHNTPGQFVVSGTKSAVDYLLPLVKENKGRAMPLKVSGAFHSPLMTKAGAEMSKALDRLTWKRPRFAVYSNVSGQAVTDGESLKELAKKQMTSPVLWIDTISNQYKDGIRTWMELGPKGVLSRMVSPILEENNEREEVKIINVNNLNELMLYAK